MEDTETNATPCYARSLLRPRLMVIQRAGSRARSVHLVRPLERPVSIFLRAARLCLHRHDTTRNLNARCVASITALERARLILLNFAARIHSRDNCTVRRGRDDVGAIRPLKRTILVFFDAPIFDSDYYH